MYVTDITPEQAAAKRDARRKELLGLMSTDALVAAVETLDAQPRPTQAERLLSAWACDEIVTRMGGFPDDAAFDALLDTGITYVAALIATFPELAA
jgi:hypothetical protein